MKELIARRHIGVFLDVEELILKRLINFILHCTFCSSRLNKWLVIDVLKL
jgi:hypothetical protein